MRKTVVQCDFDGTITMEDASFLLLDAFTREDWRQWLSEYRAGRISVGQFNTRAFATIKEDESTLAEFIRRTARIRPGFRELLDYCRRQGLRFAIVSNGLEFYIKAILSDLGAGNIEVYAARARFRPTGIEAEYIGPDGTRLDSDFKEAYTRLFLNQGYRVVYVGNGVSDITAARLTHQVFARGEMLDACKQTNLSCTPFVDLHDVARGLEVEMRK